MNADHTQELTSPDLLLSLSEARQDTFDIFSYDYEVSKALGRLWTPEAGSDAERYCALEPEHRVEEEVAIYYALDVAKPNTWSVAFTPSFRKSVAVIDKKLQGRVLVAIADLCETPNVIHGDTVKPLVGAHKGLWRYRVGDYRLVYEPRQEGHLVVLLHFAPRGGAYEA